MKITLLASAACVLIALCAPLAVGASNATFRTALNTWSNRLSVDASAVGLAAKQRHPRRMTTNAVRFHQDALRARSALNGQKVTLARVRRARLLALRALAYYARAGNEWAASGRARLAHKQAISVAKAKAATLAAATGSRLLLAAGKLAG